MKQTAQYAPARLSALCLVLYLRMLNHSPFRSKTAKAYILAQDLGGKTNKARLNARLGSA